MAFRRCKGRDALRGVSYRRSHDPCKPPPQSVCDNVSRWSTSRNLKQLRLKGRSGWKKMRGYDAGRTPLLFSAIALRYSLSVTCSACLHWRLHATELCQFPTNHTTDGSETRSSRNRSRTASPMWPPPSHAVRLMFYDTSACNYNTHRRGHNTPPGTQQIHRL